MDFHNVQDVIDGIQAGPALIPTQGTFEVQGKNQEEIGNWLASKLSELLGINADEIDFKEPFANFGLNSIAAVSLSGDLEDWLGCELPATLLWDYPTIEALARYITLELTVAA